MRRGLLCLAMVGFLVPVAGCELVERDRAEEEPSTAGQTASVSGLTLALEAPGALLSDGEARIRLSLSNRADTAVQGVGVELMIPSWMQPIGPEQVGMPVTMVAPPEGGIRLSYPLAQAPLAPGETRSVTQRIHTPALPQGGGAGVDRVIRARLIGADGQPLGAVVQSPVMMDTAGAGDLAGADTASSSDSIHVEGEAVGPVRLGMTTAELRQAVPNTRDTSWQAEGTTERGQVVPLAGGRNVVALIVDDTVARILIDAREPRTPEGLGVGSTLEDLRAAYDTICGGVGEGTVVVWSPAAPYLSFALDVRPPANWDDVRNNPEQLPDSAAVTGMWVRHGTSTCPPG